MRGTSRLGQKEKLARKISFEKSIDELEKRLKEKIEVATGFADPIQSARKMELMFKFFDRNGSGAVDIQEFFAAMSKFNFVGVQREIEALFNRYDEDASGTLDYKEFSHYLYGIGSKPSLDTNSRSIVEKVKARIIEKNGSMGIHGIKRMLNRMDVDGSQSVDSGELYDGLRDLYDIDNVSESEMRQLFSYFDKDGSGRISAWEFLRGLKTGMSYERKMIVREAWRRFDKRGAGRVTIRDVLEAYDTTTHPSVAGGSISPEEAARQLLAHFEQGTSKDGNVTWAEFLDYYRGLSMVIDDDGMFELMMRNAWRMAVEDSTVVTSTRRVLVVHTDGTNQVVELKDDLGVGRFDADAVLERLQAQGIRNIADIRI